MRSEAVHVPLIELNLRSTFINRFKDKKDNVNFELCMESYQQRNALNCISMNLKFVHKPCYKLLFKTWIFRLINLYKPCGTAVLTFRKFHSVENWYKFLPAREKLVQILRISHFCETYARSQISCRELVQISPKT